MEYSNNSNGSGLNYYQGTDEEISFMFYPYLSFPYTHNKLDIESKN